MMEAETHIHENSSSIGALQISQATYGDEENAVEANYMSSPEHNNDMNIRSDPPADERESQPKQGDDAAIDLTASKEDKPLSSSPPADDVDNPGEEVKQQQLPSSSETEQKYRNINSYYGHKIGFYQTLSLILNACLMLYAHLGLSAVIYSSRDPSITSLLDLDNSAADSENKNSNAGGADANNMAAGNNNSTASATNNTTTTTMCNEQDINLWIQSGGQSTRPKHSNYCSRTYTDSSNKLCLVTPSCISECFQSTYGYSELCSNCFAAIPTCSMKNMCTFICAADSFSTECQECNMPCVEEFHLCSGLPKGVVVVDEVVAEESIAGNNTNEESSVGDTNAAALSPSSSSITPPTSSSITQQNVEDTCNRYDLSAINEWYTAYELTFVRSIKDAWNGDAQVLAIIIVLFSGIWPYAKNIILVIVWYTPMSRKRQSEIILWLSRLSKYTLVDVFAVIGVLVGVQLQLNVGGTDAVIRAEPRFGIIVS